MQLFLKLFGSWLQFHYRCFDRVVLNGYLWAFLREGGVVKFFREVCRVGKLTKAVLSQRTQDYNHWVAAYCRNQKVPLRWSLPKERKEAAMAPWLARRKKQGRFGVYYVLMSRERGPSFRILEPQYATADENYTILRAHRGLYRHYYFYIYDEVLGALLLRVGSFFPFAISAWINGHEFMARELHRRGHSFRQRDNAFCAVGDPQALLRAAGAFTPEVIQARLDYWSFFLGPKFSAKERAGCGGLQRDWYLQQVEYCLNFVFRRHHPIRRLFERACELSLYLLTADRIGQLFAQPVRRRVRGKVQTVLERLRDGSHVFRAYWKKSFLKAYEKYRTFLRLEIVSNRLQDFGLKKALATLPQVAACFEPMLERFAQTKAEHLNVHGDFDLIAEVARPRRCGAGRVAGLKLENRRIMRLLEVLQRRAGGGFGPWRGQELRATVLETFGLKASAYSLGQLRYDLRKLKAHGIIERRPHSYAYQLTARGTKIALLLTLFARRIYGPICAATLQHRPAAAHAPASPFEKAYAKVDHSIDELVLAMAA